MTGTSVSQVAEMLKGMQNLSSAAEKQQGTDVSFGSFLNLTAGGSKEDSYAWTKELGNIFEVKTDKQNAYEAETAKNSYKDIPISKSSDTDIRSKLPDDAEQKLEEFADQVKDVLEEELGVSEEELIQAMEALGLTLLDLTEPANLAQLVMELTGSQDGSELLLSTQFQSLLTQVEELSENLMAQLNLSPEEFSQFTEQLKALQNDVPGEILNEQEPPVQTETEGQQTIIREQEEHVAIQDKVMKNEGVEAAETEEVLDDADAPEEPDGEAEEPNAAIGKSREQNSQEAAGQEMSGDDSTRKETLHTKADTGMDKTASQPQNQMNYQTTVQTVNNGQNIEVVQTVVQTNIDVESLMRQISQMTKISVTQAQSSIEMQLNPANLGKVYLQVVAKDGVITAQLAAQNEAVKEAIESQIVTLRENMSQQGMKVEAIEVTIASHEFERNLEENQQNPSKEQQEGQMGRSSRRNININNLEELEGLMSEEENLAAKIMSDNGNSVDLTA